MYIVQTCANILEIQTMCNLGAVEQLALEEKRVRKILTHTLVTICFFRIIDTHLQPSTWPSSLPGHHSKYKKKLQKVWRKNCNAVAEKLLTSPTFIDFRMRKLNFCSTMNSTSEEIFTNTCIQNVKRLPLTAIVITSASNALSKKDAKKTFTSCNLKSKVKDCCALAC